MALASSIFRRADEGVPAPEFPSSAAELVVLVVTASPTIAVFVVLEVVIVVVVVVAAAVALMEVGLEGVLLADMTP